MFNVNDKIDIKAYSNEADEHSYVENLEKIDTEDAKKLINVGVDTSEKDRAGTFIQKDRSVVHCKTCQDGVEIMGISEAEDTHPWLKDYFWKNVSASADEFTDSVAKNPHEGYFIRTNEGVKTEHPVQSCLYLSKEGFSQNVHNIVIAEPDSELHIITGCATAPHLVSGMHIGVSEFYVKKGAKLMFTMIHEWGDEVNVRPKTGITVEEGGIFISNYISLKPVGSLKMFPTTRLTGEGAIARFQSVLVASQESHIDVGGRVILDAPNTKAEIISRAITYGGTIIARGDLVGKYPGIKAHLECKGLILNDGLIHAIPELQGHVPGVEMSHEAAVGKIDQREIEYLMSRGLDEDEAISTIVRGFLHVDIEGLPEVLRKNLDDAITESQKDMM